MQTLYQETRPMELAEFAPAPAPAPRPAVARAPAPEDRVRQALEVSRIALWELDCLSGMVQLSGVWSQLLGGSYCETHVPVADLLALVPEEDRRLLDEETLRAVHGDQAGYSFEHRVRRVDGQLIWIHSEGQVVERDSQGRALRLIGTNREVTRRRQAEDALRLARDTADAASQAKTAFLATISHEIRTPLNGIVGLARLLLDEQLGETARQHAELIDGSAQALLALVNDVLDLSKIEAGQMQLETITFNVHDLVEELATLYRLRASEKSLLFRFHIDDEVPRHVVGDPVRLRQVLANLLGNALKFTSHGWIGLHVGTESSGQVKFVVRDTGIGIPEEAQARLFKPFSQADGSTSRRFGGTGLGLSIVRQLCDLMQGEVGVHSKEGNGSRFAVTLPMVAAPAEHVTSVMEDAPSASAARVLVAEDNTTNQVVAMGMLRKLGYTDVTIASDGVRALKMGGTGRYDIILMDCQMPEMDGYEATRRLRAAGCTSVIIAMTANAIQGDRERCVSAGMDDYITKPIALRTFGEMLCKWVLRKGCTAPMPLESTGSGSLPSQPAAFNWGEAKLRFGDDRDLLKVALTSFTESTPKLLARLAKALDAEDRFEVRLQAHSAKGSGAMVCADAFAAVAAEIEEGADTLTMQDLLALQARLRTRFDAFATQAQLRVPGLAA